MAKKQLTTTEISVSKTKEEVIKEAKRIEETLLYSAKGHFVASYILTKVHLALGIPIVILSALAGASALSQFDPNHIWAGASSLLVVILSSVMTFLNPNEKSEIHRKAGNNYDSLMNKTRIFWSIDCWRNESEKILTEKLRLFSDQKSKLNDDCPQIPWWAYKIAKKGIEAGEGDYSVDQK